LACAAGNDTPGDTTPPFTACPKESIVLEAQQEIALRCGQSSLTLRRDGKIVLRGRDVVSRASRRNKIRGGSVDIN
jgi:hypothetical protein